MPHDLKGLHSIEAEQGVLAAILKDEDVLIEVTTILPGPEAFFFKPHRRIYEAVLSAFTANDVTIPRINDWLREKGQPGDIEVIADLLTHDEYYSAKAKSYATQVVEKHQTRKVLKTCEDVIALIHQGAPADVIQDTAEQSIFEVTSERGPSTTQAVAVGDCTEAVLETARQYEAGTIEIIKTGITALDNLVEIRPAHSIIVAADTSMGKSALALSIADHVARVLTKPVGIVSLEMTRNEIVERLMCNHAGVSWTNVRLGRLNNKEHPHDDLSYWDRFNAAEPEVRALPIRVDDSSSLTPPQLLSSARRMKALYGIELLIVDYLQKIYVPKAQDRVREIGAVSRNLAIIAKDLNIPVISLSQLSRASTQRADPRPRLSDLLDSGDLEREANTVIFIHYNKKKWEELKRMEKAKQARGEGYNASIVLGRKPLVTELIVAKQRGGSTGSVEVYFRPDITKFGDLSHIPEQERMYL